MPQHTVLLPNGHVLPRVGLGVYQMGTYETYPAVLGAIKLGYRHVDTAQFYNNEEEVGRAVRDSGVPRDQIFVTTKLWRSEWGYEKATQSIKESSSKLNLGYIDLMLLHSPGDPSTRAETWRALEDAQKQGLIRSIGVSNFGIPHLEKLLKTASIKPAVNQIELSPFLQRREVVKYCKEHGIVVEAYSPLLKGDQEALQDLALLAVARKHGKSTAQILIRWSLQSGFIPLPKSVNPERQAANLDVFTFKLSDEDMEQLNILERNLVTGWDPITQDEV